MVTHYWNALVARLEGAGNWIPNLAIRLILCWEFWEAGSEKYGGSNWFAGIQSDFPFPFTIIPPDLSWLMATWFEIIGAIALLLGLATRFFAFSLLVLTVVATAAVHWPTEWTTLAELWAGYRISADGGSGNFKLPLLFFILLLPLIFRGAGKFSLDYLLARNRSGVRSIEDGHTVGIAAAVIGIPLLFVLPLAASILLVAGVAVMLTGRYRSAEAQAQEI